MDIHKDVKIEKACSKDAARPWICNPYYTEQEIDGKKGPKLVATDGHVLAIVPVLGYENEERDTEGFISVDSIKDSRILAVKKPIHQKGYGTIQANGSEKVIAAGIERKRILENEKFPDISKIIPEYSLDFSFSIDANLLKNLVDSLGCDGRVQITVERDVNENGKPLHKPVKVEPIKNYHNSVGYIMPLFGK